MYDMTSWELNGWQEFLLTDCDIIFDHCDFCYELLFAQLDNAFGIVRQSVSLAVYQSMCLPVINNDEYTSH